MLWKKITMKHVSTNREVYKRPGGGSLIKNRNTSGSLGERKKC